MTNVPNTASADASALAMFQCARRPLRVTASGCSRLWREANQQELVPAWKGSAICRGCPVGAGHAGGVVNPTKTAAEALKPSCVRCFRVAQKRIGGVLCVSCYNREREVRIGRNAKGAPPWQCAARLHPHRLVVQRGSVAKVVARDIASSATEMMLTEAKFATAPLLFGWAVHAEIPA